MNLDLNNINWKFLYNYRKDLFLAVALVIAGLLISIFATYPQIDQALKINKNTKKEEQSLNKLQQKIVSLENVKTTPEFLQSQDVDKILPSHKPLLELLTNLNKVASRSQVSITALNLSQLEIATDSAATKEETAQTVKAAKTKKTVAVKNYDSIKLNVVAEGTLDNVENFIQLIERVSPITTITNIALSRRSSDDTINTKAELTLKAFFFTQSISAALEASLPEITSEEKEILQSIIDYQPAGLEQQTKITGGGKDDLFGEEQVEENTNTDDDQQSIIKLGGEDSTKMSIE